METKLSLITPFAGDKSIKFFLQSLLSQSLSPSFFEFIIVQDGPLCVEEIVGSYNLKCPTKICTYTKPVGFEGHTAGILRNIGVKRMAKSSCVIVFIDSDCILHPSCLEMYYDAMINKPGIVIAGQTSELPVQSQFLLNEGFYASQEEIFSCAHPDHRLSELCTNAQPANPIETTWDHWYTSNAAVRKEAFQAVGGFSENGFRCHDLEFAYRLSKAGITFRYQPAAQVVHIEHFRQINFRNAQIDGWKYLAKQHPEMQTYASDRIIEARRALKQIAEICEGRFQRLIGNLDGMRFGYDFVVRPGTNRISIDELLSYIPFKLIEYSSAKIYCLRLHKNCWDYKITFPIWSAMVVPDISIVIPHYNREKLITRAISSVLVQTHQNFEIIIIDDGSKDTPNKGLQTYFQDSRIRIFNSRTNQGLSKSLNLGLELSRAPLVMQLDADDWLEPIAIQEVLKAFEEDEALGAVYGDAFIHSFGCCLRQEGKQLDRPLEYLEYGKYQVPRVYKRAVLLSVNGWVVTDGYYGREYEDRRMLYRLAQLFPIKKLDVPVYHVDETPGSLSRGNPIRFAAAKLAILYDVANSCGKNLLYSFNGRLLSGQFEDWAACDLKLTWSIIIPFHANTQHVFYSVRSWLESDLTKTPGFELIIIKDGSQDLNIDAAIALAPSRIRVYSTKSKQGPAMVRNWGAKLAKNEMLFFSDSDHIVPPNVISIHEKEHLEAKEAIVAVGSVFGRRAFTSVSPGIRRDHRVKLLDSQYFRETFRSLASKLAAGKKFDFIKPGDDGLSIWEHAIATSSTDAWLADWGEVIIKFGRELSGYPYRWTKLSSGSMSIEKQTFESLDGFDEDFNSMEDWEMGIRLQKKDIPIICVPNAEPLHQIHEIDRRRSTYDWESSLKLQKKHPEFLHRLLLKTEEIKPPAAKIIAEKLAAKNGMPISNHKEQKEEGASWGTFAITFDDGPHPFGTVKCLEVLAKYNVKATFFFLGAEARRYSEICKRVLREGHEIAVHAWTHTAAGQFTSSEYFLQLQKAVRSLEKICNTKIRFARPPYGELSFSYLDACRKLNLQLVGWDISTEDWNAASSAQIIKNLAIEPIQGKVILFHDGCGNPEYTAEALDWLLYTADQYAIRPVNISQFVKTTALPLLKLKSQELWT